MNHVTVDTVHDIRHIGCMVASTHDSPPPDDLGERRAEVTREAIRTAVTALMVQEHPSAISIPAVAARAGVSVRTVYRYFPNKQALLDDVAYRSYRQMEMAGEGGEALFEDPRRMLPQMWRTFAEDLDWVRADHVSPAGRDMRDRRLGRARVGVDRVVKEMTDGLQDGEVETLTDAVVAVTSSSMFLELHDRMGIAASDAAELAIWIVDAMMQRANREGLNLTIEGASS